MLLLSCYHLPKERRGVMKAVINRADNGGGDEASSKGRGVGIKEWLPPSTEAIVSVL